GIAPVSFCVQVPEKHFFQHSKFDSGHSLGDFSADKSFAATWRLMIEENAGAGKEAVPLAIIDRHPMSIEFGGGIRATRLKRRLLVLRARRVTVHLAARGLIKLCMDAG